MQKLPINCHSDPTEIRRVNLLVLCVQQQRLQQECVVTTRGGV